MKDIQYLLALHSINGLGPIRLKSLLEHFSGDPKNAWEADIREIRGNGIPESICQLLVETKKTLNPDKYLEDIQKAGIKWKTIFDESYPKLLKEIFDPPVVFYYKGEFRKEDERAIGVVGTRKMSGYGKLITEKFTSGLVSAGFTIVSGLARGVDCCAHRVAVSGNGRTIAVLGGGVNRIFPPENTRLAEEIANGHGAVISEFPPDHPSVPGNFPARNRIISGLSLGVLVTEAAADSGSLITARLATEQGREVFAIPGPITSDLSRGTGDLIREGARLVFEASEIMDELGIENVLSIKHKVLRENLEKISEEGKNIMEILQNESKHIDEIGRELNLHSAKISAELLKMEITGLVKNLGGGIYSKT